VCLNFWMKLRVLCRVLATYFVTTFNEVTCVGKTLALACAPSLTDESVNCLLVTVLIEKHMDV